MPDGPIGDRPPDDHALLGEERRIALDREQLAQAYTIQVVMGEAGVDEPSYNDFGDVEEYAVKVFAVMIVNRGQYTISKVEARFCLDGQSIIGHRTYYRMTGFDGLPDRLRVDYGPLLDDRGYGNVLTPWDTGIRIVSDSLHVKFVSAPFALVYWTDHWGTRWEHRQGRVRPIREGMEGTL